ncbi:MAG: hypothetical protein J7502_01010 [Flavisolibacter sp.]|nr:hypothetical protein [Flavisolibacter sp.]
MANIKVVNTWSNQTPLGLLGVLSFIISQLTGNSNFPTPVIPLATLTTFENEFATLINEADNGDSNKRNERDDKAAEICAALLKLSKYVELQSTSKTVAESSGFTLAKDPSPIPPIEKPTGLRLFDGVNSGEILAKFNKVQGSRAYMYQISTDPADESKWVTAHGTIRQNLFTGLESGKKYYVRVAAIGIDNQVVYSDVVFRVAQ